MKAKTSITLEQKANQIINQLDAYGRSVDSKEYGLPTHIGDEFIDEMRKIVLNILNQ